MMRLRNEKTKPLTSAAVAWHLAVCTTLLVAAGTTARATENKGSVYPIGAETVMPGITPAPGQTVFAEFDTTYQANSVLDGQGKSIVPGFKLSVYAVAPKITHNWGVNVLGGTLVSWVATPVADVRMVTPAGTYQKTGFSNPVIGVADVAYSRGNWHWWYGLDVETPAVGFHKTDALNVGQNNFATAPVFAFTYLPNQGGTELSSRIQYIVNYTDSATNYRSGNELVWEYDGMEKITKRLAIGANGYFHLQTTSDLLNNAVYEDGNRVRDLGIGPEVRYQVGPMVLVGKYFRDTLVQNGTRGNAYWIELAVPLSHPKRATT
jgi:hypothetical protein